MHCYHFLELSSELNTETERDRERNGVGGGRGGPQCILSRFKQAQNKRPVEVKVQGRQSVYNLAYSDASFTYFL